MTPVVDAHTHLYPESYIELLRSRSDLPRIDERDGELRFVIFPEEEDRGGRLVEPKMWSVDEKLAFMDEGGFERSVVSLGNPWLDQVTGPESAEWAARINADLAGLEARTDGRLHALGVLPNAAPAEAAATAAQIAAADGLYGVVSGARICGLTLDDPALEPVWAELARTGLPIFFHPHYAIGVDQLGGFGAALPLGIGFPVETSVAVARLVFAGVLQRHPGLNVLVAHAGGVLPFLAARLDVAWRSDPLAQERLTVPPSGELAKLWLDGVGYHPRALLAAADLVGPDRIVFGTDHPFFKEHPKDILAAVDGAFAGADREAAAGGNAIRLFGLPE